MEIKFLLNFTQPGWTDGTEKPLKMTGIGSRVHDEGFPASPCLNFLIKGLNFPVSEEDTPFWQANPFQQYH